MYFALCMEMYEHVAKYSDQFRFSVHNYVVKRNYIFSPRPAGGAESAPPLLDFLNNSKTAADIDTKFGVPYPTSI